MSNNKKGKQHHSDSEEEIDFQQTQKAKTEKVIQAEVNKPQFENKALQEQLYDQYYDALTKACQTESQIFLENDFKQIEKENQDKLQKIEEIKLELKRIEEENKSMEFELNKQRQRELGLQDDLSRQVNKQYDLKQETQDLRKLNEQLLKEYEAERTQVIREKSQKEKEMKKTTTKKKKNKTVFEQKMQYLIPGFQQKDWISYSSPYLKQSQQAKESNQQQNEEEEPQQEIAPQNRYIISRRYSNKLMVYNFQHNTLSSQIKETKKTDLVNTFALQLSDQKIILSGGWERDQNRFSIIEGEKIQELYMKYERAHHRLIFNSYESVYICGGYDYVHKKYITATEIFTLNNQFKNLAECPQSMLGHGLTLFEDSMYAIGGWDGSIKLSTLYSYNVQRNEWVQENARLPFQSDGVYCITIKAQNSIFLFDNKKNLCRTCTFDNNDVNFHGDEFPGPGSVYM